DDLSLFCNGDSSYVAVLKNALKEFGGLSVVSSMQVYWASVFILPSAIANDIERLMRDFLWNYGVFKSVTVISLVPKVASPSKRLTRARLLDTTGNARSSS
ncbi:hypothetical protein Tco_0259496, partial [Tanacetum coccineum]